jgi:hypothetical protein
MRTTLDIDDDVLRAAKDLARREKKTAGKVISSAERWAPPPPIPPQENRRRCTAFAPFQSAAGS